MRLIGQMTGQPHYTYGYLWLFTDVAHMDDIGDKCIYDVPVARPIGTRAHHMA